ncbi:MAG: lysophospholipid acyltransferase family protein [Bdellovibrionales bacterium]
MINFFGKKSAPLFDLKNLSRDVLLYRVMPYLLMEIVRKYFRLEVEGLEHLPKTGRCLITPNHSGYSGFDAVVLGHEIYKATGRIPRVLTHHLWFMNEKTSLPAQKMGFVEATTENGNQLLKKNNMVVLFPEGEHGNFKPTQKRYRLQEFKRGFIRMALNTKAPIIPTLIIGAEETHINLRQLKFSKFLHGVVLPLPLNVIPLPAKWKIIFMEPVHLPYKAYAAEDSELMRELASDLREKMQRRLNKELAKREYIYFEKLF